MEVNTVLIIGLKVDRELFYIDNDKIIEIPNCDDILNNKGYKFCPHCGIKNNKTFVKESKLWNNALTPIYEYEYGDNDFNNMRIGNFDFTEENDDQLYLVLLQKFVRGNDTIATNMEYINNRKNELAEIIKQLPGGFNRDDFDPNNFSFDEYKDKINELIENFDKQIFIFAYKS